MRSKHLMRKNTYFPHRAAFAYVYYLCALSGLCVRIRILRVKWILRTCMACALKAVYAYEYVFACRAALLQRPGDLFEVSMIVVLDVIRFV